MIAPINNEIGNHNELNPHDASGISNTSNKNFLYGTARYKAQRQLALSEDSPFNTGNWQSDEEEDTLQQFKLDTTNSLKKETDEIKLQLKLLRERLDQLDSVNIGNEEGEKSTRKSDDELSLSRNSNQDEKKVDIEPKEKHKSHRSNEPKLRPLTGKADCPNCSCDRRSSVCDNCIHLSAFRPPQEFYSFRLEPKVGNRYDDERPIRPMKQKGLPNQPAENVIDDVVVPNKLYTLNKSLNDKRTKLTQAIDDLQLMMDQVKLKGERLEQERKVAQLYKDQWKLGPSIGGSGASSRDRLGSFRQTRNYESRFDQNLARDTNSMMGFQNVGSTLKLRQYTPKSRDGFRSSSLNRVSSKSVKSKSKSLESLRFKSTNSNAIRGRNLLNSKTSSDLNLNSSHNYESANQDNDNNGNNNNKSDSEVHEELEEEIRIEDDDNDGTKMTLVDPDQAAPEKPSTPVTDSSSARASWVPVFGETEVKVVKRIANRKVQVMKPANSSSILSKSNSSRQDEERVKLKSSLSKGGDLNASRRTMVEANKKLKFATDLLKSSEGGDGSKGTQIIINKTAPVPKPRSHRLKPVTPRASEKSVQTTTIANGDEKSFTDTISLVKSAREEISRLEERVSEQQNLLKRLTEMPDRQQVMSPITVSSCCHHKPTDVQSHRSQLVTSLRERLNKSKAKLARSLESHREKHEQLRLKVDSSLRKQSDLESENELLKNSLNRCIDTCLADISTTFESLNETLDSSFLEAGGSSTPEALLNESSGTSKETDRLTNAAKLITDNRYLRQMKSHIETIESQRRYIFQQLSEEKHRNSQLEINLKQYQSELTKLNEAKRKLENQLELILSQKRRNLDTSESSIFTKTSNSETLESPLNPTKESHLNAQPSQQQQETNKDNNGSNLASSSDEANNSLNVYKDYIDSLTIDIESFKRDREFISSELDNLKEILKDMNKN